MMSLNVQPGRVRLAVGFVLALAIAAWAPPWVASPAEAQEVGVVTVAGVVLSAPEGGGVGTWRVGPYEVRVFAETRLRQDNGRIRVGAEVEVQGILRERRTIEAQAISSLRTGRETAKLVGLVEALPAEGLIGTWAVSGASVLVTESTEVVEAKGAVAVGALVKVEGAANEDGSITASSVTVQRAAGIRPATCEFIILKLRPPAESGGTGEGVVLWRHRAWSDGREQIDVRVAAEELAPESEFSVSFDAFEAGTILTNDAGEGRVWFSTEPRNDALPLPPELEDLSGFAAAQVATEGGEVVLRGAFAEARHEECGKPGLDYLAVAPLIDAEGRLVGSVAARVTTEEQNLDAMASGLTPLAAYRLVIDGVEAGSAVARDCGHWSLQFSTAANGRELPLPDDLDPVSGLLHVELRAVEGDVLAGEGSFAPVVPVGPVASGGPVRKRIGR
ncbi:MAG: DUF5666 domain-containing protein [Acidobacteriota bacterium]